MATPATLSDPSELHARLHDLAVVALRTRGRRHDLLAAVPGPSAWAGPAAVAYTAGRLTSRAAALGALADALDAVGGQLGGVVRSLPPVALSGGVDAASPPGAVRHAQRLLAAAGASPGPVDGVWGAASVAAVARVQARAGLPTTGTVDAATALAISAAAAGGAVAVGGTPGVPHGLEPLAGQHPVVAPPAAAAPPAADPPAAADPDPSASADPAGSPTGDEGTDPTDGIDPTAAGGAVDGGTADGGTDDPGGDDPGGDAEGADPGPSDDAGLTDLLRRLAPSPSAVPLP